MIYFEKQTSSRFLFPFKSLLDLDQNTLISKVHIRTFIRITRSAFYNLIPLVCAQLYEHQDHGGYFIDVNNGEKPTFIGPFWNDQVSSIIVMAHCALTLYENSDFGGKVIQYTQSVAVLDPFWNDQISSYECICDSAG